MPTRPQIEPTERDTILGQLRKNRKWTSRRAGARIRFWTEPSVYGARICFQVFPRKGLSVTGKCSTLSAAIAAVNEVLQPVAAPIPLESPTRMPIVVSAAPARAQWLPYADN